MADTHCLAIDAMGGDFGPRVTVPATFDVLRAQPQLKVVLLGDEKQLATMSAAARALDIPNAPARIAQVLVDLAGGKQA